MWFWSLGHGCGVISVQDFFSGFFFCIHIQYDFSVCYFMSYPVGFFCVCSIFALA